MIWRGWRRRWRGLRRLPAAERRLLLEAVLTVVAVRLLLLILPFSLAMRICALEQRSAPGGEGGDSQQARRIGRAVRRAVRHLPLEALCLPRALAAARMLRRRRLPAEVIFGVKRCERDGVRGHAWCLSQGVAVIGTKAASGYAPIARYHG